MSFASLLRFWKLKVFWNANVVLQPPELQAEANLVGNLGILHVLFSLNIK